MSLPRMAAAWPAPEAEGLEEPPPRPPGADGLAIGPWPSEVRRDPPRGFGPSGAGAGLEANPREPQGRWAAPLTDPSERQRGPGRAAPRQWRGRETGRAPAPLEGAPGSRGPNLASGNWWGGLLGWWSRVWLGQGAAPPPGARRPSPLEEPNHAGSPSHRRGRSGLRAPPFQCSPRGSGQSASGRSSQEAATDRRTARPYPRGKRIQARARASPHRQARQLKERRREGAWGGLQASPRPGA